MSLNEVRLGCNYSKLLLGPESEHLVALYLLYPVIRECTKRARKFHIFKTSVFSQKTYL